MTLTDKEIQDIRAQLNPEFLMRQQVLIDCGHLPVRTLGNQFILGNHHGIPSEGQTKTLEIGSFLFKEFADQKRKPRISICLTDTTKYILDKNLRKPLSNLLDSGDMFFHLPTHYREIFDAFGITKDKVSFSLQSKNSNKFSALIKKMKHKVKKSTLESIFKNHHALFISDSNDGMFGFSIPFLFDNREEITTLGGDYWLDETYQPSVYDALKAPLIRLKKLGVIKLHNKTEGILCPATYGGLLLNFLSNDYDYVSIYARADDEFIAEKIARGVIASFVLEKNFNANCIQITIPEFARNYECSYLSRSLIFTPGTSFRELYSNFRKNRLFDRYTLYL